MGPRHGPYGGSIPLGSTNKYKETIMNIVRRSFLKFLAAAPVALSFPAIANNVDTATSNIHNKFGDILNNFYKIAQNYVGHINDSFTRNSITEKYSEYLDSLVKQNKIYDYAVSCTEGNNSSVVINNNQLFVDVALKPVNAVEYIYVPIRIQNK
jgi:hypothetical protein